MHNEQRPSQFPAFSTSAIVGIILLIILIHIGFYHTYIKFFPKFEDTVIEGFPMHFGSVQHFHGMMMMGWVFMLLLQPTLILNGKMKLHRLVGKFSYVLAPLVILAMYLINQHNYNRVLAAVSEREAVAEIALVFPAVIFFTTLYLLAIRYKHNPALHMRFMISTAFLFVPPAMDRALIFFLNLPGYDAGSIIELSIIGGVVMFDSLKTKRLSPFALVFAFEVIHTTLWHSRETDWWQRVGSVIAKLF